LGLNLGSVPLLFYGFIQVIVAPALMTLVDLGPLGEEVEHRAFVRKLGLVSLLSGGGGILFANTRRIPLLTRPQAEGDTAAPSKTMERVGVAGMAFVCLWLLSLATSLTGSYESIRQSLSGSVAFALLFIVAVQGLALLGFVFNTLAHLWLVRFPSERGAALALSSACVQTGVVAAAVAMGGIMTGGLEALSAEPSRPMSPSAVLVTAQVLFVTSLLFIAWNRRPTE
jgi:hypothetical protein